MKIKEILAWGAQELKGKKEIKNYYQEAEILLIKALNKNKTLREKIKNFSDLIIHQDIKINQRVINDYQKLIERRKKLEPIAYLIGEKEFYGLSFKVNKNVLIPRPDTELLVEKALEIIKKETDKIKGFYKIAEIGTGSGCISIALAKELKKEKINFKIFATEISQKALQVAFYNAKKHKVLGLIKFYQGDLFASLKGKFHLILANLPYVSKKEIKKLPITIKNYEPQIAFNGGEDGLEIYHRLIKNINSYILPQKSKLILEIGYRQKNKIINLIKKYLPLVKIKVIKDYTNLNRLLIIYF